MLYRLTLHIVHVHIFVLLPADDRHEGTVSQTARKIVVSALYNYDIEFRIVE
jgi:hypothetical protein